MWMKGTYIVHNSLPTECAKQITLNEEVNDDQD